MWAGARDINSSLNFLPRWVGIRTQKLVVGYLIEEEGEGAGAAAAGTAGAGAGVAAGAGGKDARPPQKEAATASGASGSGGGSSSSSSVGSSSGGSKQFAMEPPPPPPRRVAVGEALMGREREGDDEGFEDAMEEDDGEGAGAGR